MERQLMIIPRTIISPLQVAFIRGDKVVQTLQLWFTREMLIKRRSSFSKEWALNMGLIWERFLFITNIESV